MLKIIKIIKKILQFVPFLWLIVIFFPKEFKEFGEYAWNILIFIMFLRPLADITNLKILKLLLPLRKELGIIVWVFSIAHFVGYFIERRVPLSLLWNSILWDPRGYLWAWMFALVIAIILTLTSNIYSIKKLWKYWKKIQRLSYFMFIFVLIHIALIKGEYTKPLIMFMFYSLVYVLAYKKVIFDLEPYSAILQKKLWIKM